MLYVSSVLVLVSSFIMIYTEGKSFLDALWWSIVTVTTVGYGDISPATSIGRVMAVVLMIFGREAYFGYGQRRTGNAV